MEKKKKRKDVKKFTVKRKSFRLFTFYSSLLITTCLFILEYIFILSILKPLVNSFGVNEESDTLELCSNSQIGSFKEVYEQFICCVGKDFMVIILTFFSVMIFTFGLCYFFFWRYNVKFLKYVKFKISKTVFFVFISISLLTLFNIWYQDKTENFIYSFDNFLKDITVIPEGDGKEIGKERGLKYIHYSNIFQLLIGSPLAEEFILRVVLILVFRRTLFKYRSKKKKDQNVNYAIAIFMTSLTWSLLHLVNSLFYASNAFVNLQALTAFVLGMFYSTRFYIEQNIIESLFLHLINNIFGALLPISLTWERMKPFFWLIFCQMFFYFVLFLRDVWIIRGLWKKKKQDIIKKDTKER